MPEERLNCQAFFGDQADRLLRKEWADPNELAQELFAMFTADVPMTTDQPIVQTRNTDGVPAYKIIDNTDGSSSPIVLNRTDGSGSPQPNMDSNGGYSCCGSAAQNQPPQPSQDPSQDPFPPLGTLTPDLPPPPTRDPNTAYRKFQTEVQIKIIQGPPDIYHWNGQEPAFVASGCFPYNPPTIPGPHSPFDPGFNNPNTITDQIAAFMNHNGLDGYSIVSSSVSQPGPNC